LPLDGFVKLRECRTMAAEGEAESGTIARRLIRGCDRAALATILDGRPYASLVITACEMDASPLLLLSDLAQHSKNLVADPAVSLLFDGTAEYPDPLTGPRLTLLGRAERCDDPRAAARFAARHPSSAGYAGFADFHLYRVAVERGHLVAGFGRISWVEREELQFTAGAAALAAAETEIVEHMNTDHADAVMLYAEKLLRRCGAGWRMTGIDPEGIDLRRHMDQGGETARLDFARPVLNPAQARTALVELVKMVRQQQGN
jgi:heme iron utilization protein